MPDTQYFTNIDGKYVKDAEARQQLNDLEDYVESLDQPWQPLHDGYSNFWFELTDDTLSPWLNFSAKTENAVIDWGDGSGEVALDTLTPTHTYAKAGKYVVKVKGVTGIAKYNNPTYDYAPCLTAIELNSEITGIAFTCFVGCGNLKYVDVSKVSVTIMDTYIFGYCGGIEKAYLSSSFTSIGASAFIYGVLLRMIDIPDNSRITTIYNSAFFYCLCLEKITIPASVTTFGNSVFANCVSLSEVHVKATVPPTLGNNTFQNASSDYIIYVPVGTAETYKAASVWSTYADHILEEGQTPNRAMLAKFNSAKTDEPQDDMR